MKKRDVLRIKRLINDNLEVFDAYYHLMEEFVEIFESSLDIPSKCKVVHIRNVDHNYEGWFTETFNFTENKKLNSLINSIFWDFFELGINDPGNAGVEDISENKLPIRPKFILGTVTDCVVEQIDNYLESDKFNYYDEGYRRLRLQVFLRDGEVCARCGSKPAPGSSLTVDHIKPVSKYPELAKNIDNLQVLCWNCNQLKSNKHETDYRI